jgi:hypothetical protein
MLPLISTFWRATMTTMTRRFSDAQLRINKATENLKRSKFYRPVTASDRDGTQA